MYTQLRLDERIRSHIGDITDRIALERAINAHKPEILLHLAAQAIVGMAHEAPFETWRVNALGTVAALEAACRAEYLKAAIIYTTDKVYANDESGHAYQEDDRIGGHGIYDSSKSAAELAVQSFSHDKLRDLGLASIRAGNVIGGGDWAPGRLVPDCVRAFAQGKAVQLRNPYSIRPWQHVLDVCDATLRLAQQLYADPVHFRGAWNIGPDENASLNAASVAQSLASHFGIDEAWIPFGDAPSYPEAHVLRLDSRKFREKLHWQPALNVTEALDWSGRWYKSHAGQSDTLSLSLQMLQDFRQKRHLQGNMITAKG